ncbi:hypothetical protein FJM67_14140 [Maribrevibacterium harenarium]|uniref:Lipoprotein n=1 Tax=Maribrevibacterium harenarium TaxID=2589817 RepID=A0A501WL11_9GAMM|nr:hypothetical protein [Maribrevibacterium harenarium]TPE47741.1 hypothetical protein FJM67_14140 [Maribrevibacterium harenarium]
MWRLLASLWAVLLVMGCSNQSLYESGTGFRIQQCSQIRDRDERSECLERATRSYQEYQSQY